MGICRTGKSVVSERYLNDQQLSEGDDQSKHPVYTSSLFDGSN